MSSQSIHAPHNQRKPVVAQSIQDAVPSGSRMSEPLLHVSGVDVALTDKEVAGTYFQHVLPIRPKIDRDLAIDGKASGTIEFENLLKAEKAYATIKAPFQLHLSATGPESVPETKPLLVKHLPLEFDHAKLFDLFRPFGALFRLQCIDTNPAGVHTGFQGSASVQYYDERHARRAQDNMHCADVEGNTISVTIDLSTSTKKLPLLSAKASTFDPTPRTVSVGSDASVHAAADRSSTPDAQRETAINPCNLFVKNLDSHLDSKDLFNAFRTHGRIISAKVMCDAEGKSRQFGFVSYTNPEEATRALHSMDNMKLGSKTITVCVHEPKALRTERLTAQHATSAADPDAITNQSDNMMIVRDDSVAAQASEKEEATRIVPMQRNVSSASSAADNLSLMSAGHASAKERERLLQAVTSVSDIGAAVEDITDMLASLSRKDRALCLFNPEVLKLKVEEAREILDMTDESAEDLTPATPTEAMETVPTKKADAPVMTIATLAALPALEILRLADQSQEQGLPLPKADRAVFEATNTFVDSLADKAPHDQKQKLGDQLFKKIKTYGIKGAPKITIQLLDTEDLRSLAHLMNSYEAVLKQKVLLLAGHTQARHTA